MVSLLEERGDLIIRESSNAAADAGDEKMHFGMFLGKDDEFIYVGLDEVHAAMHSGYGVTFALQTHALSPDGTELIEGNTGGATAMHASQVAAENKNLIVGQRFYKLWRNAVLIIFSFHLLMNI
jgi:hypothetical protein